MNKEPPAKIENKSSQPVKNASNKIKDKLLDTIDFDSYLEGKKALDTKTNNNTNKKKSDDLLDTLEFDAVLDELDDFDDKKRKKVSSLINAIILTRRRCKKKVPSIFPDRYLSIAGRYIVPIRFMF